jgi:hypothetical protein
MIAGHNRPGIQLSTAIRSYPRELWTALAARQNARGPRHTSWGQTPGPRCDLAP